MVDSCQHCDQCHHGDEQFCREGITPTYGGIDCLTQEITQGIGPGNRVAVIGLGASVTWLSNSLSAWAPP
jgi:hypothetical protein